ncbi:hypothetical protein ElyMa_000268300 [Elysia marginata]|uniref:PH domain-containing protein n=1 Tax=Elysia marginata TaxID=1093978 RepID=A0AAV4F4G3_9GAST|nr:hypothetical protein ElyMa_000268300 [Elysia marginata]
MTLKSDKDLVFFRGTAENRDEWRTFITEIRRGAAEAVRLDDPTSERLVIYWCMSNLFGRRCGISCGPNGVVQIVRVVEMTNQDQHDKYMIQRVTERSTPLFNPTSKNQMPAFSQPPSRVPQNKR